MIENWPKNIGQSSQNRKKGILKFSQLEIIQTDFFEVGGGVLDNRITVSGLLASRRNTALTADIRVTNNQRESMIGHSLLPRVAHLVV